MYFIYLIIARKKGQTKINCNLQEIAKIFLQWSPEFDTATSTISPTHLFGRRNPVIRIPSTKN
jgi:hypothetical protein